MPKKGLNGEDAGVMSLVFALLSLVLWIISGWAVIVSWMYEPIPLAYGVLSVVLAATLIMTIVYSLKEHRSGYRTAELSDYVFYVVVVLSAIASLVASYFAFFPGKVLWIAPAIQLVLILVFFVVSLFSTANEYERRLG